jgi:predicted Zn finger-like uncharacterized protein
MHIVCPHCTTSYAISAATLGAAGRTVRCSRCKEVWLAHPEDAIEPAALAPAMAETEQFGAEAEGAEWGLHSQDRPNEYTPIIDSPPLAGDWPADRDADSDWPSTANRDDFEAGDSEADDQKSRQPWFRRWPKSPALRRSSGKSPFNLTTACAAMGALVLALIVWRADVVRLLPQTATFYRMVGLEVNLRGLLFKDVKISTETVDGKPVLVIEGAIVGAAKKPVDIPRLRFAVRDAQGAEIYAWNTVLEQTVLNPGERAFFKSRLASPPAEGRNIDIRFFNRRDIAGGSV